MNDLPPNSGSDTETLLEPRQATCRPRVTVSTVCCLDDQFLIVEETVGGRAVLNLPGGHLDPGETLVEAARRESLEESGWRVDVDALVGIYQWRARHRDRRYVRFVFAAQVRGQQTRNPEEPGILAVYWLSRQQLQARSARLRSPLILQIIDHYLAGQRYPLSLLCADSL